MPETKKESGIDRTLPEFGPNSRWTRPEPLGGLELAFLSWDERFDRPPPKGLKQKIWRWFSL
jgi:hypothetical protein